MSSKIKLFQHFRSFDSKNVVQAGRYKHHINLFNIQKTNLDTLLKKQDFIQEQLRQMQAEWTNMINAFEKDFSIHLSKKGI